MADATGYKSVRDIAGGEPRIVTIEVLDRFGKPAGEIELDLNNFNNLTLEESYERGDSLIILRKSEYELAKQGL